MKPGRISFTLMFINMILLWASWINMCDTDVVKIPIPDAIRYGGLVLFFAGVIIFFIALSTIKAVETHKGDLVTRGIYLIGYSVFCGALLSCIVSTAFIANILFWRYLEEKELTVRFPMYGVYKKKTVF
jgi:protein-S-isoprenylcysteine O-methyltransferase Ste14